MSVFCIVLGWARKEISLVLYRLQERKLVFVLAHIFPELTMVQKQTFIDLKMRKALGIISRFTINVLDSFFYVLKLVWFCL
jgi:hypothetical protein